jgi:DNA repair exonuclease SbcCD ATPase subunit
MIKITALIKQTEAAISKEKDPEKAKALRADLAAYKKTEKHVEHVKTEEDDSKDDEDKDEPADEEDDDEEKAAKAAAKEADEKKASKEKADDSDADKKAEKEEAKAVLALARAATGKKGTATYGALAALLDKAAQFESLSARVEKIESASRKTQRDTLIQNAINGGRITEAMVAKAGLRTKKLEMVESYLEMFPSALIHTDDGQLAVPNTDARSPHRDTADLPAHITQQINEALAAAPAGIDKKALRESLETNHRKSLNGAAGGRL